MDTKRPAIIGENTISAEAISSEQSSQGVSNMENSEGITIRQFILIVKEWWTYLLSEWVIILIVGIIGGGLGVMFAYLSKPVYKAELSFALEDDKGTGLGGALGLASQFGFDLGGGGGGVFTGDNLLQLMKSRLMIEKTLLTTISVNGRHQPLIELYISFNKFRENDWNKDKELKQMRFLPNSNPSKLTLRQDSLIQSFHQQIIANNLTIDKVDKKVSIVAVRFKSENEIFSKYFVEILIKEVSDFYKKFKTEKSAQNVSILQHQTDSVRTALNQAISGAASLIDVNPNANASRQILKAPTQRRQVDIQANTEILKALVQNLELSKVTLRKETPLIQVIDRPMLPLEKLQPSKKTALIQGGFLSVFILIVYLIIKRLLKTYGV